MPEIVIPKHAAGFSLRHNENRTLYRTVAEELDVSASGDYYADDSWAAPGEKQAAIDTNELWTAQWYPDTPVGFIVVHASTLERLVARIREIEAEG